MDDYDGEIKIVFKHFPLPNHKPAFPAAEAAIEAYDQGKFWEYHDILFANRKGLKRENFLRWAEELGLDAERMEEALEAGTHKARVNADKKLGSQFGVRGTPAFFVNGRFFSGAKPYEFFKTKVEAELKRAQKLLDSGVSRERLYEELTRPQPQKPVK